MYELSFVTIGDLHLDKKRLTNLLGKKASVLQLGEVRKVLDYAILHKIKYAFFLGDISDEPSLSDYSEKLLIELLLEYDRKIHMHIILGNHDIAQKDVNSLCKISLLSETKKLKTVTVHSNHNVIKLCGIDVEFMPYPNNKPKKKNSICIAHIEVPGATLDNGYEVSVDDNDYGKDTKSNLWILGHLHTPQTIKKQFYYSGTLYQTSFGEFLDKSFIKCETHKLSSGKLRYKLSRVRNYPEFKLRTYNINNKQDIKNWNDVKSDKPYTFYRVFHKSNIRMPLSFMRKNPNVIECKSFKDNKELNDLIVSENISYKITDGLVKFLRSLNMSSKKIKKAKLYVKTAISKLS